MKFVIQRVQEASVDIDGHTAGSIGRGFMVLIGITDEDNESTADRMIEKMLKLRIFADSEGKTNLDLSAVQGSLLLISQFTLYADCRKGNRPSFVHAGQPDHAKAIYDYIVRKCSERVADTAQGSFGADMQVKLVNDGPFTVVLDSVELGF
jgi:D-tyrosyl-tRNA(Tyr) deacylase